MCTNASRLRERAFVFSTALFLVAALVMHMFYPMEALAENRLYHLRVTLRSGERFETISASDPINYCHANGGSVVYLRDYSLIYSAEMKVKVLSTWIDTSEDLAGRWPEVLRARNMLSNRNHKPLPRVEPLTLSDMRHPG